MKHLLENIIETWKIKEKNNWKELLEQKQMKVSYEESRRKPQENYRNTETKEYKTGTQKYRKTEKKYKKRKPETRAFTRR